MIFKINLSVITIIYTIIQFTSSFIIIHNHSEVISMCNSEIRYSIPIINNDNVDIIFFDKNFNSYLPFNLNIINVSDSVHNLIKDNESSCKINQCVICNDAIMIFKNDLVYNITTGDKFTKILKISLNTSKELSFLEFIGDSEKFSRKTVDISVIEKSIKKLNTSNAFDIHIKKNITNLYSISIGHNYIYNNDYDLIETDECENIEYKKYINSLIKSTDIEPIKFIYINNNFSIHNLNPDLNFDIIKNSIDNVFQPDYTIIENDIYINISNDINISTLKNNDSSLTNEIQITTLLPQLLYDNSKKNNFDDIYNQDDYRIYYTLSNNQFIILSISLIILTSFYISMKLTSYFINKNNKHIMIFDPTPTPPSTPITTSDTANNPMYENII